jgi:hypothetical protein
MRAPTPIASVRLNYRTKPKPEVPLQSTSAGQCRSRGSPASAGRGHSQRGSYSARLARVQPTQPEHNCDSRCDVRRSHAGSLLCRSSPTRGRMSRTLNASQQGCERKATRSGATTSCPLTGLSARSLRSVSKARNSRSSSCGRHPRPSRNGCARKPTPRGIQPSSSKCNWTALCRRCRSTRSSAPTLSGWDGNDSDTGLAQAARERCRAGRGRGNEAKPAGPRLGLRAAVRQHERRRRAGIFQRRHQRGHHHRPVEGLGAVGDRPQHRLHSSRASRSTSARSRASSASATSWKAACARPATACGSPPS